MVASPRQATDAPPLSPSAAGSPSWGAVERIPDGSSLRDVMPDVIRERELAHAHAERELRAHALANGAMRCFELPPALRQERPRYLRNRCNPSLKGKTPGRLRHLLRDRARSLQRTRVGRCGAVPLGPHAGVECMPGRRLLIGTQTERCGSTWECPVCAAKRSRDWAARIVAAATRSREEGYRGYLLTLTVPHQRRDDFGATARGISNAYRRLIRGAPWVRFRSRHGVRGYIRGAEDTRAEVGSREDHGWHPHLHVFVVARDGLTDRHAVEWLRERWERCCEREGLRRPSRAHGLDLRETSAGAADYLAKLGLEVSGAEKPRAPWRVLERALEGDRRARAAWRSYCAERKGKRRITVSRSLSEWAKVEPEPALAAESVYLWEGRDWRAVRRALLAEGLDRWEASGASGLARWIEESVKNGAIPSPLDEREHPVSHLAC